MMIWEREFYLVVPQFKKVLVLYFAHTVENQGQVWITFVLVNQTAPF